MFSVAVSTFHGNPSTSDLSNVALVDETPHRENPQTSTISSPLQNCPNISNMSAPEGSSGALYSSLNKFRLDNCVLRPTVDIDNPLIKLSS